MKRVLMEDTVYPYIKPNAQRRLDAARHAARASGMLEHSVICLGGYTWCIFPWLGTRSFRTFRKYLAHNASQFGIANIEFEGCNYIIFRMERADGRELIDGLANRVRREGINTSELVGHNELPVFEKYDTYIPGDLLRKAYAADRLRPDEVEARIVEMQKAFEL